MNNCIIPTDCFINCSLDQEEDNYGIPQILTIEVNLLINNLVKQLPHKQTIQMFADEQQKQHDNK